ncbi:hypothetical protein GP486_008734 [Trichoglossum hirsutum]|uniref:Uncharacterized protein n=1 Tax=Trichoglossum hirsutum TaxID=265104 RepID=A0A9P8L2K6_9PEZI|nr:hypothetical protein GP486_008734 [Trichoglossum hirsutum]
MKAVKQFKNLIFKKGPRLSDGILGGEIRIVHPPRSMSPPVGSSGQCRSRSLDTGNRRSVEQALSSEDVHGDVNAFDFRRPLEHETDSAVVITHEEMADDFKMSGAEGSLGRSVPSPSENAPGASHPVTSEKMRDLGKGQAHDPLDEDPPYLNVGPGGEDTHLRPSQAVSESPPATDANVYETAYREEVERIRQKQGRNATVYLTRRVESQVGGESDVRSTAAQKEKMPAWIQGGMRNAQ